MDAIRRARVAPATVIACIALLISLTGTSVAAVSQLGRNSVGTVHLKNSAVTSPKVKNGSLLRTDFKAGQVPAGPRGPRGPAGATGVTGGPGPQGPVGPTPPCPPNTRATLGACIEVTSRGSMNFYDASVACGALGRRLPTANELMAIRDQFGIVLADPEVTSNIFHDEGAFQYVGVNDSGVITADFVAFPRQFRCVSAREGL